MIAELWQAYRLRWRRRRLLWRAFRKRRELAAVADRTAAIGAGTILCFSTVRDEAARLPRFLRHHRDLGVGHFLIVDNGSTDGTAALLAAEADVSLWTTGRGYRAARFGADWLAWLQMRHGHGHWCLTADVDELLIYPHWRTRDLRALTGWLDDQGRRAFPAMMLDLYPQGPLSAAGEAAPDPAGMWFDAGNYTLSRHPVLWNLWIQGGVRARVFFADAPRRAPTLTKTPLVRWDRRYVYVNSTHSLLPRALNLGYDTDGGEAPSGILLHTKFLQGIVGRAVADKTRGQHFHDPAAFADYYDRVIAAPDLWTRYSRRYSGWRALEALGLMSRGGWM